ncbi:DUF4309 domain-containing protein [Paenibacillus sp. IB182496]|uniref:DUF4309 domain-containing protein n=1 Tax=Paenibacillus sabuli TaxID=2772509 RepID=A0A927BXN8_9BACL|nr:DUF4309 domain-containing protein [Paenibacillus sabuli]MBD2847238.1 DUF4309 domain-containing protein [Paenibacillus sabuli]
MRRAKLALAAMLLVGAVMTGCTAEEAPQQNESDNATPEPPGTGNTNELREPDEGGLPAQSAWPEGLYEGEMEGVPFAIGDYTNTLEEALGQPSSRDYFSGGLYYRYPTVVFFTDAGMDDEGQVQPGKITALGFPEGAALLGVTVGDSLDAIAAVLGEPDALLSPEDTMNSELYDEMWAMEYDLGEYVLVFSAADREAPTSGAYYLPL